MREIPMGKYIMNFGGPVAPLNINIFGKKLTGHVFGPIGTKLDWGQPDSKKLGFLMHPNTHIKKKPLRVVII